MKENHDIRAIVTQQGNRFQISCIFVQIPQHRRIIVQPLARFASAWYWLTVFVVICSIALRDDKGLPTVVANPIHLNHRFLFTMISFPVTSPTQIPIALVRLMQSNHQRFYAPCINPDMQYSTIAAPTPNRAAATSFAVFCASFLLLIPCIRAKKMERRGSLEKKREHPARMIRTPKIRRKTSAYFISNHLPRFFVKSQFVIHRFLLLSDLRIDFCRN